MDITRRHINTALLTCILDPLTVGRGRAWASTTIDEQQTLGAPGWDEDTSYDIRIDLAKSDATRTDIRYIADFLVISSYYTPSLIRTNDDPANNVSILALDARRLDVSGSIALSNAKVLLFSQELHFTSEGLITLFGDFINDASALSIITENLYIDIDTFYKPINILPSASNSYARISISAVEVRVGGKQIYGADATQAIWNLVALSDQLDSIPDDGSIAISVGDDARNAFEAALKGDMLWPAEVYSKALRRHAAFPFDKNAKSEIAYWEGKMRPILAKTGFAQAAAGFPVLAARISAGLDAFGHGEHWAPRKSLDKQLSDFNSSLGVFATSSSTSGGSLSDELIDMIAKGFDRVAVDTDKLEELKKTRDDVSASIEDLDDKIQANLDETHALGDQFNNLQVSINAAQVRIARASRDEEKRLRDAASAKAGLSIAGTVVGIATSIYAGPQAGAAVATGFNIVGNIVYAHNQGDKYDIKSVSQILADAKEFYADFDEIQKKWSDLSDSKDIYKKVNAGESVLNGPKPADEDPDNRKPYTKAEAAGKLGASVADFGSSLAILVGKLQVPVPEQLSLTDKEALDPDLQESLEKLAGNQKRQSELIGELQGLQNQKSTSLANLTQTKDTIDELLKVSPTNDLEFVQWTERARYLWLSEIQKLVGRTYLLQRAFEYETGTAVPLRRDIVDFPSTLTSAVDAGTFDVLAPGTRVSSDKVRAHLATQRARIMSASSAFSRAISAGVDEYLALNQQKFTYQRAVSFSLASSEANRRLFVRSVNAQIALTVWRMRIGYQQKGHEAIPTLGKPRSPAADWTRERKPNLISLYIPFLFEPPLFADETPLRFVRAWVDSIEWQRPRGGIGLDGIEFTIVHPGYGEAGKPARRRFIDLRENQAVNEIRQKTTLDMIASRRNGRSAFLPGALGKDYYTYYPARTDYFFVVDVTTANFGTIPIIRSMNIVWEVFQ